MKEERKKKGGPPKRKKTDTSKPNVDPSNKEKHVSFENNSLEMYQVYESDSRYKISVAIEIKKSSGNPCVKKESSPGLKQKVEMSVRKAIAFLKQKNQY